MASLHFVYSAMNAGKSSQLLQVAHNYEERGLTPLLYNFAGDNRYGECSITSRIGLKRDCEVYTEETNLLQDVAFTNTTPDCILIDEAQFLTEDQVDQLCEIVDFYNVPVMCYGLRTDFQGKLFAGSKALFAKADNLQELKTICHCGRKANFVLRYDDSGNVVTSGDVIQIGGNEQYESVCRKHFTEVFEEKDEHL